MSTDTAGADRKKQPRRNIFRAFFKGEAKSRGPGTVPEGETDATRRLLSNTPSKEAIVSPNHEHTRKATDIHQISAYERKNEGEASSRGGGVYPITPEIPTITQASMAKAGDARGGTTLKEGFLAATRFGKTLLKKFPDCFDGNPVKMALSILKVLVEIGEGVGDNSEELRLRFRDASDRMQMIQSMRELGITEDIRVGEKIGYLDRVVNDFASKLAEEILDLEGLSEKPFWIQLLDFEDRKRKIEDIVKAMDEATKTVQLAISFKNERMVNEIAKETKRNALKELNPSIRADHRTELGRQSFKRETCTANTRVGILNQICDWANDPHSPRVFWLTGPAGSGKTTIAYSVTKVFDLEFNPKDDGITLGGNFLCSRQYEETRRANCIIPTIAYHLARHFPSYANALHASDKFDTVHQSVKTQIMELIVRPWLQTGGIRRYLIVIDALDELDNCEGPSFLAELLTTIDTYDLPGLKFFVTSRTNPEIAKICREIPSDVVCHLQEVHPSEIIGDIETYLESKLPRLARSTRSVLATQSGGLFVYAATAVRYVTDGPEISPEEQTEMLRDLLSKSYDPDSAKRATAPIDALYQQIVQDVFGHFYGKYFDRRLRILHTVLCTSERTCCEVVASLVDDSVETVNNFITALHSVLYKDENGLIFWYHASFPDFIFDGTRSTFASKRNFRVSCDPFSHHLFLARSSFRIFNSENGLRFNIACLSSSYKLDAQDLGLEDRINANILPSLRYTARYWLYHLLMPLTAAMHPDADVQEEMKQTVMELTQHVTLFLKTKWLFWVEAMNLLGMSDHCTPMLTRLASCFADLERFYLISDHALSSLLDDAADFSTHFAGGAASLSTPHLYLSSLSSWGQHSSLCRDWMTQFQWLPRLSYTRTGATPLLTVKANHSVRCASFSRDCRWIATGLNNSLIYIFDSSTGNLLKAMDGHIGCVRSVAFSNNGMYIVSGSNERPLRLWDASSGRQLRKLEGHTGFITSTAFSSDDKRIVSGSDDCSVRIWDTETGTSLARLVGHSGCVYSVSFSSDGRRVVSGSGDKSVRIWAPPNGSATVLRGHDEDVNSIAFSKDGKLIASGSDDRSIRIWDSLTGHELRKLTGHTGSVYSLDFSFDGKQIVSGSFDRSVRIWDATTGDNLKKLDGHTNSVYSVLFSSDGRRIASASWDATVRIWKTSMEPQLGGMSGHNGCVNSVVFSPDGSIVASGSSDRSARIWDATTGQELAKTPYHTNSVASVSFSSDGMYISSRSLVDAPIHVWGTTTEHSPSPLWSRGFGGTAISGSFSNDTARIVSGPVGPPVRILEIACKIHGVKLVGHSDTVNCVVYSRDERYIASASKDESVRIWDASTGNQIRRLDGNHGSVLSAAFSSDDDRIASGHRDGTVFIWNTSTGAILRQLNVRCGAIFSVAFSSGGRFIVIGCEDRTVRILDASTGTELQKLEGHSGPVCAAAFSTDDQWIVSGSKDSSIRIHKFVLDGDWEWKTIRRGWIHSAEGQRFMWLPDHVCRDLYYPHTHLLISRTGRAQVDFTGCQFGENWATCFKDMS